MGASVHRFWLLWGRLIGGRRFLVVLRCFLCTYRSAVRRVGVQHQQAHEDHMLDEMVLVLCFPFHFLHTPQPAVQPPGLSLFSLFACWFQPAQTSQPTVFSSHKKPAPAPTSEQAHSLIVRFVLPDVTVALTRAIYFYFIWKKKSFFNHIYRWIRPEAPHEPRPCRK